MKKLQTYFLISVTAIALMIVLIIQVNWILETAKIKEDIFNEKANMVLSRTTDAINSDVDACRKIGDCADQSSELGVDLELGKKEVRKIDSLFNHYMRLYNFHIGYTFIVRPKSTHTNNDLINSKMVFNQPLTDVISKSGVELKLIFPAKNEYILAEMGVPFVSSVLLILLVLFMFWRTIHLLWKEKEIADRTTDFLNNMTHEFKTPLTNIALAGKMMTRESAIYQEDKVKQYSNIILFESDKLKHQVEQVLSMSALERGEIPLDKTEFDFHELILNVLNRMKIQIENESGLLNTQLNADKFTVIGDKTHLTNAVSNLIDNAIKYSNGKPEILIETYNAERNIMIVVSDNGLGIDQKYQKKVFDKFFRVPTGNLHNVKGFGLGLAYVRQIVELHGGSIRLQSSSGKGTTFIVGLPYA